MKTFILFIFIFGLNAQADIIKCRGNIGFWALGPKNKWTRVEMVQGQTYIAQQSELFFMKIGQYQKYPAVTVSPFFGIEGKVINKETKFETDNERTFKVSKGKQVLNCDVTSEAAL